MSEQYTNLKEIKIKCEKLDLDTHSQGIVKCQNTSEKFVSPSIRLRSKSLDNCGVRQLISQNILNKSLPSNIKITIAAEKNLDVPVHIKEEHLSQKVTQSLNADSNEITYSISNKPETESPLDPNFLYLEAAYLNLRRSSINSSSNKNDLDPCSSVTDETVTAEKITPLTLQQSSKNSPNVNQADPKFQENESTSQSTQECTKGHFISMSQIENSQEPVITLTEIDPLAHSQPCKDDSIKINVEGENKPKIKLHLQPLKCQSPLNISQNVSVENITNNIPVLKNDSQNAQLIKNMNTSLSNNEDTLRSPISDTANTEQNKLTDHGITDKSKEKTKGFQVKNTDSYSQESSCLDDVQRQTKLIVNKDMDATTDMLQTIADEGNTIVTSDNTFPVMNYISMSQIQNTQQDLNFINAIDPLNTTNNHQTTVTIVDATNNNDVGNTSVISSNILPGINYVSMSEIRKTQQDLNFTNSTMQQNQNDDSVASTIINNIKNISMNETYDDTLSDRQNYPNVSFISESQTANSPTSSINLSADKVGLSTLQDNKPMLNIDQKNPEEEISRPLIVPENVDNSNFNEDEYEECILNEDQPFQHLPFFFEDKLPKVEVDIEPINIKDSRNVDTSKLSCSSPNKVCENEQSVETDNLTESFYSAQSTQDKINDKDQQKCINIQSTFVKDVSNVTDKYFKLINTAESVSVRDNALVTISADDTTEKNIRIRCRNEEDTEDIPFPKRAKVDVINAKESEISTELIEHVSPDTFAKEIQHTECSDGGDVELDLTTMELPLKQKKSDSKSSVDLTEIAGNIEQEAVEEPWWIMKTLSQGFDEDFQEFINFSPHVRKPSLISNTAGESKLSEERYKSFTFYLQLGDLRYIPNHNSASRNVLYQMYGETFDTVMFYGIIVDVRKMKQDRYMYVVDDGTGSVQVKFNHSSKQQKKHLSIINYLEQQLQLAEQFGLPNMLPDSKTGPRADKLIQEMKQLYQPLRKRILSPMTPLELGNRAYVLGKLYFCPREQKLQVVAFNLEVDETAGTGEIAWKRFLIKIYEEYYYKRTREGNLITMDKTNDCKTN